VPIQKVIKRQAIKARSLSLFEFIGSEFI
jgi:hypothetical protein